MVIIHCCMKFYPITGLAGQTFAYSAVEQLSSVVTEAPNYAIPFTYCVSSKYFHCFSSMLKYYIHRDSCLCLCHCYKNNKSVTTYATSLYFQEGADSMLKTQTKYCWKYVPNFKKKEKRFIQLKTDDKTVTASKTLVHTSATALNTVII
jgi:hypothetical protein